MISDVRGFAFVRVFAFVSGFELVRVFAFVRGLALAFRSLMGEVPSSRRNRDVSIFAAREANRRSNASSDMALLICMLASLTTLFLISTLLTSPQLHSLVNPVIC